MGQTNVTGSLGWSETDSNPYGGCNWVFSQAVFHMSSGNFVRGPGWVQSTSYAISDSSTLSGSVLSIVGTHNLCSAGGPCSPPGSQPWGTTYN
jgi:hypothetical protein